jgi:hypothetical protein
MIARRLVTGLLVFIDLMLLAVALMQNSPDYPIGGGNMPPPMETTQ